jgi:hypothetical protein
MKCLGGIIVYALILRGFGNNKVKGMICLDGTSRYFMIKTAMGKVVTGN